MFDVLKTLSGLVKTKRPLQKAKQGASPSQKQQKPIREPQKIISQPPHVPPQIVDMEAELKLAQAKAREIIIEAKDEALRIRRIGEEEMVRKSETIDRREGTLSDRERRLDELQQSVEKRLAELEELKKTIVEKLEKSAHLTSEEARTLLMTNVQDKLKEEIAKEIRQAQTTARETAQAQGREILVEAMRHGATDYVAEYTVSVIKITDEEVKGRIIGKEGRNIRAFETATGVDVDLDEEGIIRLSSFDPVRREIARVALERLLRDGRVQPGRIEELIEQVKKEVEKIMFEEGQKLAHAVGVYNLPAPIVALLGRFKYRSSYGQNMIAHTLEETKIGVALANEVGADVNVVRLGCLLHDIGKIITDQEGSHVDLGVALLKKYGMPQNVIDCVAQHHEDTPFTSIESVLVYIADAISGSRPGARYEDYDAYIKRLTDLEAIAKSHEGVKETYAFSAGRELRIIVDPGKVDDATATILASTVKDEIEKKMTYPGQIKITIIRELRATEIAK